jgi:hypothetical protein
MTIEFTIYGRAGQRTEPCTHEDEECDPTTCAKLVPKVARLDFKAVQRSLSFRIDESPTVYHFTGESASELASAIRAMYA